MYLFKLAISRELNEIFLQSLKTHLEIKEKKLLVKCHKNYIKHFLTFKQNANTSVMSSIII